MPIDHPRRVLGPQALWVWSHRLHLAGHRRLARALKAANYVVYRAFLPPEAEVSDDVALGHLGFGVVVHRHVTIGRGVHIWQGAMFVSDAGDSSTESRIVVGDDVEIGAGAIIVNKEGRTLRIGTGARIGAGAVVTRDVAVGAVVVGQSAQEVHSGRARNVSDPAAAAGHRTTSATGSALQSSD